MTDKLELKSSHEVVYTVNVADVESIFYCKPTDPDILTVLMKDGKRLYCDEVCPVQEEPVSEDLEEAAKKHAAERYRTTRDRELAEKCKWSFISGAEWCKKHLWKDAQGDDLPTIDREVIALLNNGKVVFAHRPYKGKYLGKNLTTGNIETFENQTYDKGGWNIPDVKYWLDCYLPKEIEEL